MVMKKMREYTKEFLIILVLAFVGTIIFNWGMNITGIRHRKGIIGEINGEKIRIEKYYQALQRQMEAYRQKTGQEIGEREWSFLEQQVWENLIQEILLQQQIRKYHITVTDKEVVFQLKNNPPEILRTNESFLTNGKFDFRKYHDALRNPQNDWRPVEAYLRTMLPYEKLQQVVTASVRVTPNEVKWEFMKRNLKAKVKYVFFDPRHFQDKKIEISDAEIRKYYQANKEKYYEVEKRRIEYVVFPIVPTSSDSLSVWASARDLIKRIKDGEDFAELAQVYSEDPASAAKGGDLGYFGRGSMVKPFEDAAFAARPGEVVGPIQTQFGLHIIKVEDRKRENNKEQIKARHILLKFKPSNDTIENIKAKAIYFADMAKRIGFDEAVNHDSLQVQTTPLFPHKDLIPGIGFQRDIVKFVFKGRLNESNEEPFQTDQGFIVLKIAEIQKARTKPLKEVKTDIENLLRSERRKELARQWCAQERQKMHNSEDFEVVAAADSLPVKEVGPFSMIDYVPGVGRESQFNGTAMKLDIGEISLPVETMKGYYLIKVVEKTPFDEETFEQQKNQLYARLLQAKRQQAFKNWYDTLKKNAKIKDFRQNI
ncbi:hypothetical protein DRQ12_07415 [candidate division KSB1 bacterium]|nr:peptidylprolyl isomerase [bacterium]OQX59407.1 MAG: hypothetical protein B5M50_02945 [candidate division KSB1 bacterium 4484_219]RKY77836.1 MAG: hypothetical protein DRQ12_07415 [candidate division KSB1 bacterium]